MPPCLNLVSGIASLASGGGGPVCRHEVEELARLTDWQATLLGLHAPKGELSGQRSDLRMISLGPGCELCRSIPAMAHGRPTGFAGEQRGFVDPPSSSFCAMQDSSRDLDPRLGSPAPRCGKDSRWPGLAE
jgi:hypothetical protein